MPNIRRLMITGGFACWPVSHLKLPTTVFGVYADALSGALPNTHGMAPFADGGVGLKPYARPFM